MKGAWSKGSFTVEASLLMAILIPLLVGMMYLGFYLHNRAFLPGAACELAQIGLLYDREEDALRAMKSKGIGSCWTDIYWVEAVGVGA